MKRDPAQPAARSQPPTVAVVIACYDHGRFLREAVESVRRQTRPVEELLIVNDGSTEPQTLAVLNELEREGVRVLNQANQGLAAARNAGIRATRATHYIPLDADDRLAPRFVERLLPAVQQDAQTGWAYGHVRFFGSRRGMWKCPPHDPLRIVYESLCVATALVRREAFERVGGYQSDMTAGYEDWDFWHALSAAGYIGRVVPEPLFEYRQHAPGESMLSSMTDRRRAMRLRMIAHHRAWIVQQMIAETGRAAAAKLSDEALLDELEALAALQHVLQSRSWHIATTLISSPPEAHDRGLLPSQRLRAVQSSAALRTIRRFKANPIYRVWARLRYGREAAAAP